MLALDFSTDYSAFTIREFLSCEIQQLNYYTCPYFGQEMRATVRDETGFPAGHGLPSRVKYSF